MLITGFQQALWNDVLDNATQHLALMTTMPEDDGTGGVESTVARLEIVGSTGRTWTEAAASGDYQQKANAQEWVWPASPGPQVGPVLGVVAYDAAVGGVPQWQIAFDEAVALGTGGVLRIETGMLKARIKNASS